MMFLETYGELLNDFVLDYDVCPGGIRKVCIVQLLALKIIAIISSRHDI